MDGSKKELPFTPKVFEICPEVSESSANFAPIPWKDERPDPSEEEIAQFEGTSDGEKTSLSDVVCPLNSAEREDVRLGDFGTDESPEESRSMDDWNRRVIVTRKDISPEEERRLPWVKPPLDMYKKVTDALHGLDMIKVCSGERYIVFEGRRQNSRLFVGRQGFAFSTSHSPLLPGTL